MRMAGVAGGISGCDITDAPFRAATRLALPNAIDLIQERRSIFPPAPHYISDLSNAITNLSPHPCKTSPLIRSMGKRWRSVPSCYILCGDQLWTAYRAE